MDKVSSLFADAKNFLTHPLRNDYPAWQLVAAVILIAIAVYWATDNLNIIKSLERAFEQ